MRTNNKLNPHMMPSPGIEPGPHWWEASVGGECSTTAPFLLPCFIAFVILAQICQIDCPFVVHLKLKPMIITKISIFIPKVNAKQQINIKATIPEGIKGNML